MATRATARAPSSTANLGPGFDVFGLAIDAFYDEVTLTKKGSSITLVTGDDIPADPKHNTAGLVISRMKQKYKTKGGIEIAIKKGVPAGFGMGSSAASAAAAAVAFDRLYGLGLSGNELVEMAGHGERASAGSIHYDNVAASVLGGFVIVRDSPLDVITVKPPADLRMVLAVPSLKVPKKKTKVSRSLLPKKVPLADSVANLANASGIVAGFMRGDSELLGRAIIDVIVEPARKGMIPHYAKVKQNALDAGALGVTISGAGPSVIAFAKGSARLKKIGRAMERGFGRMGCRIIHCKPSRGASGRRVR